MIKRALICILLAAAPAQAQVIYFSSPPVTLTNGTLTDGPSIMADYNRIVSDGNTAYTAFLAAIAAISGAPMPSHGVVPFNLASCPTGWNPADGTAGTIDLRGRFPATTTGSPAVGTAVADTTLYHTHTVTGTFLATINLLGPTNFGTSFVPFANGYTNMTIGAPNAGNVGSETRPKNVALLFCEKS